MKIIEFWPANKGSDAMTLLLLPLLSALFFPHTFFFYAFISIGMFDEVEQSSSMQLKDATEEPLLLQIHKSWAARMKMVASQCQQPLLAPELYGFRGLKKSVWFEHYVK